MIVKNSPMVHLQLYSAHTCAAALQAGCWDILSRHDPLCLNPLKVPCGDQAVSALPPAISPGGWERYLLERVLKAAFKPQRT